MMETIPATATKRTVKARAGKAAESKPGKTPVPVKSTAGTLKLGNAKKAASPPPMPEAPTATVKSAPKPRKPRIKQAAAETSSAMAHSEAEIQHMIAEAAYFMAAQRNFAPGDAQHDWLVAEQQIRSQYQHA